MSRYTLVAALAVLLAVDALVGWDQPTGDAEGWTALAVVTGFVHQPEDLDGFERMSFSSANEVLDEYCNRCHSDRQRRGNLSLEDFDADHPETDPQTAEMVIRKLRAGMMPPSGRRRPAEDAMEAFIASMETRIDSAAAEDPNPGFRTFQRLNRAEYQASVKALIGLDIDAGDYLPLDTKSANFDNIADVQMLSPTLLDAYMAAASEITRLAVGNANAAPAEVTYAVSRYTSQRDRVPGAPFGSRGGVSVEHIFPADGEYVFRMSFQHESTGSFFGQTAPFDEQLEISVDGERVALLEIDRFMHVQDPNGVEIKSEPIFIAAGPRRLTAAFVKGFEGPQEDKLSPHDWSLADRKIGYSYGVTSLAHLRDLVVGGPYNASGVSENPARAAIFTCHPSRGDEAEACARSIIGRVATRAFRRPLDNDDVSGLMALYAAGVEDNGFEEGVRLALQAVLASPDFVFRFEDTAAPVPGMENTFRLSDQALASRLSYFLWSEPPDEQLLQVAAEGRLSDPAVLGAELDRMLADPRAEALGTRFAAQWLRLQDLDKVHPDQVKFPDYDQQLADAMLEETVRLFNHIVDEDRSVLDLLTADYTFVNERLARHYGIPDVIGETFRRVEYPSDERRGLLGHGSVLTLTSHANTTSPVLRGKWVMEVLLGSPPPAPPPNVPELEGGADEGRILTVREQLEKHRADPVCAACHIMMDPIGLALENFDVTGRWRIKDAFNPIVVEGELFDGMPLTGPDALREGLLRYQEAFVRTFTENLMAYAMGRRVEYFDMPTIRDISAQAAESGYRVSTFVEGVVMSPGFQLQKLPANLVDSEVETSSVLH